MQKRNYIIMAPPYRHNSAGVRALYQLRNELEQRGYQVQIMTHGSAPADAVVIYPETVPGNPLGGKIVVRWVLYYPGKLSGDTEYNKDEIIFTWSRLYYDAPLLNLPLIEDFFRDEKRPRAGACFWIGKGSELYESSMLARQITSGMTEITWEWPKTRRELARLLNEKEAFYTYDDCTALSEEAQRCGCKVVVIPPSAAVPPSSVIPAQAGIQDDQQQLDHFIAVTQAAQPKETRRYKIAFGLLVNDLMRLDMVFRESQIKQGTVNCHTIKMPETATKGLNKLLGIMEAEGADIAVLSHQDMYYRNGWLDQLQDQIDKLPDSWIVAGIIGKDMEGNICGRMHDMRIPLHFSTSHDFPQPASCFDECCIIVNLKKGFRFDENLTGFDLYGTLCVLQAKEMGGTAWVIDAFAEHYCMRPFSWFPGKDFEDCYKWIHQRFPKADRIDSTVIGVPKEKEEAEQAA
jgi:hypothetical protein